MKRHKVIGVDPDFHIVDWNTKAIELSHFTREDTLGRPLLEFVEAQLKSELARFWSNCEGIGALA